METNLEFPVILSKVIGEISDAKDLEHHSILEQTQIERGWWPPETRMLRRDTAREGILEKVAHVGKHYQLIAAACHRAPPLC